MADLPKSSPAPASPRPAAVPLLKGTVADISDRDLLRRAVTIARANGRGKQPRWVAVMDSFGLGSTYAHQLCRRFGFDPDELVKR